MDERRLLASVWNWLPAFKAVAQTEHLPSAAKQLGVTSSALSRSIRQLEDAVGHTLFNRVGRSITLNTHGAQLLRAMNGVTQTLEGALGSITTEAMTGHVRIGTVGVLTNDYVVPAALALRKTYPSLRPVILQAGLRDANEMLERGQLDVAFYYDPLDHEQLVLERIGTCTASVYCGRGHPLFDGDEPDLDTILEHPFSVAVTGDRGRPIDGWPIDVPRKVGLEATLLSSAITIVRDGSLLSVIPDVIGVPMARAGEVRRFTIDLIPDIGMFAAFHEKDAEDPTIRAVVDAVADRVKTLDEELGL